MIGLCQKDRYNIRMNVIIQISEIIIKTVVYLVPAIITAYLIFKDAAESVLKKIIAAVFGVPVSIVSIIMLVMSFVK